MHATIRALVELYYDLQKLRVEAFNRIVAYVSQMNNGNLAVFAKSQIMNETQAALAKSQTIRGVQDENAKSQSKTESQNKSAKRQTTHENHGYVASQKNNETPLEFVSHEDDEPQSVIASQKENENRDVSANKASQYMHETPDVIAGHVGVESQVVDARHDAHETHGSIASVKPSVLAQRLLRGEVEVPKDIDDLVWYHNKLADTEKELAKRLNRWSRNHPLRIKFLSRIQGIGPIFSSALIAWLSPISRFPNVSKLWSYCYSGDTEVLTRDGFKLFRDVNANDEIATLNPDTNEIEYQIPVDFQKLRFEGKMVHFKGRAYDLLVTPEHNVYVRKNQGCAKDCKFKFMPALSMYELWKSHSPTYLEFNRVATWKGKDRKFVYLPKTSRKVNVEAIAIDLWLKFFGWYISEGSCDLHGKQRLPRISIGQQNERNKQEIANIIRKIGFSPYIGKENVEFHSKQLFDYLKQFGRAREKFIPKWVKNLPPNRLQLLIEYLLKGDGEKWFDRLTTYSKRLADDFQEIVIKAGWASTVSPQKNAEKGYKVTVITRDLTPSITKEPKLEDYAGYVYDLTVQRNHIILVRRNGRAVWSSNCGLSAVHWRCRCSKGHKFLVTRKVSECPVRVKKGKKQRVLCGASIVEAVFVRSPMKRKRGYLAFYNPRLLTLMWKIASSFEKQKAKKSRYRRIYEQIKVRYLNRQELARAIKEKKKGAKLHVRLMSMRYTAKRFLQDLWLYWRELEGLPVTKPYADTIEGHREYEPWEPDK